MAEIERDRVIQRDRQTQTDTHTHTGQAHSKLPMSYSTI